MLQGLSACVGEAARGVDEVGGHGACTRCAHESAPPAGPPPPRAEPGYGLRVHLGMKEGELPKNKRRLDTRGLPEEERDLVYIGLGA